MTAPRPAQAVRLSWTLDDGRVLASIEGPRYAAGVVRAAVLDRCELRDLEEGALGLVFAARSAGRPIGGWWKYNQRRDRMNRAVRYALVLSLRTREQDVDLYTPIATEIGLPVAAVVPAS